MRITRRLVQGAMVSAGVIGTIAAASPGRGPGRWVRRAAWHLGDDARYVAAAVPGLTYRLSGERPDADVADEIVAERVRARLGLITKHLGLPTVTVHVIDHVVLLEGGVHRRREARRIERSAAAVRGVRGVESHLHVDDALPASGPSTVAIPSIAMAELCEAAGDAGARDERAAVHAVLCAFTDRLPDAARIALEVHLPADVRALIARPVRRGARLAPPRTVDELVAAALAAEGADLAAVDVDARAVTLAVVDRLRSLVPEATAALIEALPDELARLWSGGAPVPA
jgi:uncharacterized protein (DUF2267 family)